MPDIPKKKILIVEDEFFIVELLSIHIERLGYNIVTARDGIEGLEMVKKEKPDLIILDVGLPRMDGITLCQIVKSREATKHIHILMLTGRKLLGDMEDSFKAGADIYMNKPFEWNRLEGHIKRLLG